jgi:plasmid stabilization system protein ParE
MVPRKLDYTDEAIEDLNAIRRWLTQPGSGRAARGRLKAIRTAINRLREHPCVYPIGQHPGVRELPCDGGYRALDEVRPDTGVDDSAGDVQVLRVFGPGQSRERL